MTIDDMRDWQLTGIALPSGLDRPIAADTVSVPNDLQLVGDQLVWSWLSGARQARVGPGLLEWFVRLADAPAERILAYAQRWGVLVLCAHRLPASHNPPPFYMPISGLITWCTPAGGTDERNWESIQDWRHFARQARALLRIAAQLHDGRSGAASDWGVVYERKGQSGPPGKGDPSAEHWALAACLNEWIALGDVRPQFHWDGSKRKAASAITLAGRGLFGALAVQLAMAINRTEGLAHCSGCGTPYVPLRRPRPDQRHYCAACREAGRPALDAAHDYRRRRATAPSAGRRSPRRNAHAS